MRLPVATLTAMYAILCGCAPDDPQVGTQQGQNLVRAGRSLTAEGRYDSARITFQQALDLDSLDAEAYFELGNLDARLGRLEAALRAYRTAIKADPAHSRARHNLDVTLRKALILADFVAKQQQRDLTTELDELIAAQRERTGAAEWGIVALEPKLIVAYGLIAYGLTVYLGPPVLSEVIANHNA